VAEDDQTSQIIEIVSESSHTGNFGDGKIFVSSVDEAYTVRTRTSNL
jgi:nitrogen regulatory protein PII 1